MLQFNLGLMDNPKDILKRSDAIPLYHQLFLTLRDEILGGRRPCGSMLPTEHALADQFAVSRITARRALDELERAGLVDRRQRVGTRVIYAASTAPMQGNIDHAIESLIAFGHNTQVKVIEIHVRPADDEIAGKLGILPGDATVHALRIRYSDGERLGSIESFVPNDLGALFTHDRLASVPLLQMLKEAGHRIGTADQIIMAIAADPVLASRLEIEPRAPIIRIERLVRSEEGRPLLFTVAEYRGDRYRINLDLQSNPKALRGDRR
jgi:GntR family transcriptional regulator